LIGIIISHHENRGPLGVELVGVACHSDSPAVLNTTSMMLTVLLWATVSCVFRGQQRDERRWLVDVDFEGAKSWSQKSFLIGSSR